MHRELGFGGIRAAAGLTFGAAAAAGDGNGNVQGGSEWSGKNAAWLRDASQSAGREVMVNHSEAWNGDVR